MTHAGFLATESLPKTVATAANATTAITPSFVSAFVFTDFVKVLSCPESYSLAFSCRP